MKLKKLTDNALYVRLADEVGSLCDDADELRYVIMHGQNLKITDALDGVNATLARVLDVHAEMKERGIVRNCEMTRTISKWQDLPDNKLYERFRTELSLLKDVVAIAYHCVEYDKRDEITEAMNVVQKYLDSAKEAHAELVKRGIVDGR